MKLNGGDWVKTSGGLHRSVCVLELLCCVTHLLVSARFGSGDMFVALCLLTPCSS